MFAKCSKRIIPSAGWVNSTKRRVAIGTSLGLAIGSLAGLFFLLSGSLLGGDVLLGLAWWAALVLLSGFTGGVVSSFTRPGAPLGRPELPLPARLPGLGVLLSASGLALTILGAAISFVCGPDGSCRTHPYQSWGLIVVASGIPLFLAGLVLATSSPRGRLLTTLRQKDSSSPSDAIKSPATSPPTAEPSIRGPQRSTDHESRQIRPPG